MADTPPMSFNTTDGQPPMSLIGGGTNEAQAQPPMSMMPQQAQMGGPQQPQMSMAPPEFLQSIAQHPVVQKAIQKAADDVIKKSKMAKDASDMPDISMGDTRTKQMLKNIQAMQNSGAFAPLGSRMNHPILGSLANAAMAFGQGITKQPFYSDFQQNQTQRMQQMADMARYGQLTPEQQMTMGLRVQGLQDRETTMKNVQDQRDQVNWSQFINKVNPATASSRSTLGMTANGNVRANRALATIQNNPVMTFQDLGNVVGDLAAIYQGGSPTDLGMRHQQYDSIQTRIANMQQFLTGKPQDAVPHAIKDKIMGTIKSLKDVNNAALKTNLDAMEKAQKTLISKHPDEWQQFRKGIENDYMNSGNQQQGEINAPFQVGGDYNGHKILSVKKVS